MIINHLHTNHLSLAGTNWYLGYLDILEAKDISRYGDHLADEIEIQFNNSLPINGKFAVIDLLNNRWRSFRSVRHEVMTIIGSDRSFVSESLNHYDRHDQTPVTARAVVFTDRNVDGMIASVRVYSDTSSVFDGIDGRETSLKSLGMPYRQPSKIDRLIEKESLS